MNFSRDFTQWKTDLQRAHDLVNTFSTVQLEGSSQKSIPLIAHEFETAYGVLATQRDRVAAIQAQCESLLGSTTEQNRQARETVEEITNELEQVRFEADVVKASLESVLAALEIVSTKRDDTIAAATSASTSAATATTAANDATSAVATVLPAVEQITSMQSVLDQMRVAEQQQYFWAIHAQASAAVSTASNYF